MFIDKLKKFISYADAQLSKYFPSVRPAVLLIVIPAFFIVIAYFLNTVTGIASGKDYPAILEYENRLASIKKDLPVTAVVNYVSNSNKQKDLINTAYVLIPVRVVAGLKPRHDLLIYQSFNTTGMPEIKGYTLKKNYGNGVVLFNRVK
jgi:hypothetical protein